MQAGRVESALSESSKPDRSGAMAANAPPASASATAAVRPLSFPPIGKDARAKAKRDESSIITLVE